MIDEKIGIVGAGNIAKVYATALSTIKNVELIGVYDVNQHNAESCNVTASMDSTIDTYPMKKIMVFHEQGT